MTAPDLTLSDADLERLLQGPESDRVERKESLRGDAPTKIREAICAFANDLSGSGDPGVVLVGARDDGSPSGLDVTDDILLTLGAMRSDGNIVPPPLMTVQKRSLLGHDFAVVVVAPSDAPPVRYQGRIWIRVGPRRATASAQEERVLNERRRSGDRPFDVRAVPHALLADLDRRRFEEDYLRAAFAPDVLEANERSYEERLAATRMVVSAADTTPTVLGVLVLSPRAREFVPGAWVQFLRLGGVRLDDPVIDAQEIDGPLDQVLRRLDEKMAAHITVAVDLTSASRESRRISYPIAALQQFVRNAVMHRTYEGTHAPVRVTWYSDRIEIMSPGGPFGLVHAGNFGMPGVTDYRSPGLADAMRVLGFVQRFGVGIATARRLLAENGNPPPEFQVDANFVRVTVRARP